MAVTLKTILLSARNNGRFVGVNLRETSKFPAEQGAAKVKRVTDNYVTFNEAGVDFKVHKNTITQVRSRGIIRNRA